MKYFNIKTLIVSILCLFLTTAKAQEDLKKSKNPKATISTSISYSSINSQNNASSGCTCRSTYNYFQFELDVLYLVNKHRQGLGLSELLLVNHISNVCKDRNAYFIDNNFPMNHNNLAAFAANIRCAINGGLVSENLAYAYSSSAGAFSGWLNSNDGHREAIEDPRVTHFGVSVSFHPVTGYSYFTNIFVENPNDSCATIPNTFPQTCSYDPPNIYGTSEITFNSAKLRWWQPANLVNNSFEIAGYQCEYKTSSSSWIVLDDESRSRNRILNGLEDGTIYQWRVRTKCHNESYSDWSVIETFTTLNNCSENETLTNTISTTELIEVSNTITSYSTINSGANIIYSAGNQILLKANTNFNFHAKSNSNFLAKIEGCSNSNRISNSKTEKFEDEEYNTDISTTSSQNYQIETIKLFPNPTNGKATIESTEAILQWELSNQFGKTINKDVLNSNSSKKAELNLINSPTGLYFIKITLKSGEQIIKRVVKD